MRAWRCAVVAASLTALTACGSTVQTSSTLPAGAPGGTDGLGGSGAAAAPGTSGTSGTGTGAAGNGSTGATSGGRGAGATSGSGSTGPGSVGTTTTGAPSGAGPGSSSTSTTGPVTAGPARAAAIPEKGRGWDATTVKIGVMTQQDVQKVAEGFGLNMVNSGNQVADVKAVVADLNVRGGIAGRKVVAEVFDISTAGLGESEGQAACSHFTQDVKVVAVYAMALVGDVPTFRACMKKAQVPVFAAGGQAFDDKVFDELDGYYSLMTFPSWTRFAGPFVERLVAQGYYTGWNTTTGAPGTAPVKTGFLCPDTVIGRRVGDLMRAASVRAGRPLSSEFYFNTGGADASSAVLRFRTDGITHVLFCDLGLVGLAQQAEAQGYRPRYGISSFNTPILFLQGTVPNSQLAGSVGVGFAPTLDVDAQRDPGAAGPAGEARCREVGKRGGITYAAPLRLAQGILYDTCDVFQLIADSVAATNSLTGAGIRQGVGLAGPRLRSAYTWTSGLSPTVRANPAATRDLFFDGACSCYRYRGGLVPLG